MADNPVSLPPGFALAPSTPAARPPAGFTITAGPSSTATPEKVYYNDAGQPFTLSGAPPAQPKPDSSYTGPILPLSRDASGLHLAVPQSIASPYRGAIEGGKRLWGTGEAGQNPLRPLSPDTMAAVGAVGGLPLRAGTADLAQTFARPSAIEARQAGYVLPPAAIRDKPGMVASVLAGWSGKIKTQQAASERNQAVTNGLAAKALGLHPDTVLSDKVFNKVRDDAGAAYRDVINSTPVITADHQYAAALAGLGGSNSQAAKFFPKITNNPGIKELVGELQGVRQFPTAAGVELVKELRFSANSNLKAIGDPSKHALGLVQRQAADAVDELIERNATVAGKPDVVAAYRQARQTIAKSFDVQGSTNAATGDVNARGLARLAAKGRPLTGELDTIANAASAFPKALQAPAGFGHHENFSALDFFGGAAAAVAGHPGVLGTIAGRPLARKALLSGRVQDAISKPRVGTTPPSALGAAGRTLPGAIAGQDAAPAPDIPPAMAAIQRKLAEAQAQR